MTAYDFMRQRFDDATEHPLVKKTGTVLFHMLLAALALIMTVMICAYILYTLSFIVPPYFRFMNAHGPFSFLFLLLVWAAAFFRFMTRAPEDPEAYKWELYTYALSTFVIFTGVGKFVVLPFLRYKQ